MDCQSQGILFDHDRPGRIGLPEAVFSEGKAPGALRDLLERFRRGGGKPVLFTRLSPEFFLSLPEGLRSSYDYDPVSRTAFAESLPARDPSLDAAVVSAGTSDAPVAREAARTLGYLGFRADLYEDSGVAGLWRLSGRIEAINSHRVVIVVAGLDAALASVIGGLTPRPVVAVPTSVGYGIARGGEAALASMLLSCSPGIAVVNIDNGYGAACAAARILNLLDPQGPPVRPGSPAPPSGGRGA
ncbi:MAG: nickel pincer cofactor biosynthesis protein LarB [Deltaproteobacteria bacterium]|jgi:NCAIR mutase (PurE)-related protein|nr:nickel pincer cofactor biosynthesis protein LarB [Deltaproteobacteria bacterium]